jgi:hypothetical protein
MRRFPSWYVAVAALLAVLWVSLNAFYRLGAEGVAFQSAGDSAVSFDREFDFALFRIDDQAALSFDSSGYAAVVKYGRGTFPFCPLCGIWEPQGSLLNGAGFFKDDWLYTKYVAPIENAAPGVPTAKAYNVKTRETFKVASPPKDATSADAIAEYKSHGLSFDDQYRVTPALIQKHWEPLATINESCIVFNAAFIVLFAIMGVVGLFVLLRGQKSSPTRTS